MQEVSINVSPPMDLKKEEQGKEKQRKVQELLSRIHTNKQRVSTAILLSRALNYLPSATLQNWNKKSWLLNIFLLFPSFPRYQQSRKPGREVRPGARNLDPSYPLHLALKRTLWEILLKTVEKMSQPEQLQEGSKKRGSSGAWEVVGMRRYFKDCLENPSTGTRSRKEKYWGFRLTWAASLRVEACHCI